MRGPANEFILDAVDGRALLAPGAFFLKSDERRAIWIE
jgi:hypothetical protein